MALTFDLVQALNNVGTAGQAVFGPFSAGFYEAHNPATFQVFDRYGYRGGGTFTPGDPLNPAVELGWFSNLPGMAEYPHLSIENINNNAEITPNLWGESMYFHPGTVNNVFAGYLDPIARDAVVRFTAPVSGTIQNIVGNFLKGSYFTNPQVGFTIFKNTTEIFTRSLVTSGSTVPISITNIPVLVGDTIDFVIDVDSEGGSQDDSAITVNITIQLDKTPDPVPASVNCTDISVSGTIPLTHTGTVTLRDPSNVILGTGTITPIVNSSNGQWTVTGLNLNSFGGQVLTITALDSPSTISDVVNISVGNVGCASCTGVAASGISGNSPVVLGQDNTYTITGLTGSAPFTYTWSAPTGTEVSGQGTDTYVVNFASSGTLSVVITNCLGANSVTLNFPVTVYSADAVNDAVGVVITGATSTVTVSTNDTVCNFGSTTYQLVPGSEVNVVVNSFSAAGVVNYTPIADGPFSFNYNILCQFNLIDTATVSGTACTAPIITLQPVNSFTCDGGSVILSASATGTSVAYQWRRNGVNIGGATGSTFTATLAGSYFVRVTNSCGTVASNTITVVNEFSPIGGGAQTTIAATVGSAYSHTVTFTGSSPLTLSNIVKSLWMTVTVSGLVVTISGTPTAGDVGAAGYSFDVSNNCGTASASATGTVSSGCINITGPGSISGPTEVASLTPNSFTVSGLSGTAPYNYTWSITSGSIISGQGTDTVSAQFSANGTLTVDVTNCGGAGFIPVNKSVALFVGNAVDDTVVTTANTSVLIMLSANDIVC